MSVAAFALTGSLQSKPSVPFGTAIECDISGLPSVGCCGVLLGATRSRRFGARGRSWCRCRSGRRSRRVWCWCCWCCWLLGRALDAELYRRDTGQHEHFIEPCGERVDEERRRYLRRHGEINRVPGDDDSSYKKVEHGEEHERVRRRKRRDAIVPALP